MIAKRVLRTGDGSHKSAVNLKAKVDGNNNVGEAEKDLLHEGLWGWGNERVISSNCIPKYYLISDDKEMTQEDRKYAKILYKSQ